MLSDDVVEDDNAQNLEDLTAKSAQLLYNQIQMFDEPNSVDNDRQPDCHIQNFKKRPFTKFQK